MLYHNDMYYADVVRGTAEKVDPFANTKLKSVWDFNRHGRHRGSGRCEQL
ncbi:MAG: hypothetical protein ACLTSX_03725 [Collinsella sp.]